MPIYRKTEGGVFAPISSLNINYGGAFKSVNAAWVNDNGTFKKVFPNYVEQDASLAYDTGNASVTWQSADAGYYNNTGAASAYSYIPLLDGSSADASIVYTRISLVTANGEEIPFTTSFSASSGTVYDFYEYNNGSYVGPNNNVRLSVTDISGVGNSLRSGIAIALNKNIVDYSNHIGKTVYLKWKWREEGSNIIWTFTFPQGQLIDYTL
ncbi:hypothetical protein ABRZ24_13685 [Brenneria populi]|uniref:Uncharacterized protein n=1 Tax=Brenneria populi TaxID=1505588 RepID=A0ABU6JTA2_9GAMM|nr:hypothetical protein [Brenneria populi Li et al. 2015]